MFAEMLKNPLDKTGSIEYSKAIETKKAVTKRSTHRPLTEKDAIPEKGC